MAIFNCYVSSPEGTVKICRCPRCSILDFTSPFGIAPRLQLSSNSPGPRIQDEAKVFFSYRGTLIGGIYWNMVWYVLRCIELYWDVLTWFYRDVIFGAQRVYIPGGCASWLARIHGLFIGVLRVLVIWICPWVLQIVISVVLNDLYLASRSKSFWNSRGPFLGPCSIQRSFSVCFLEKLWWILA